MGNIKLNLKARKGAALLITLFIATVAMLSSIVMMNMSSSNTNQITDSRDGKAAYYAAEAGIQDLINLYNQDDANLGKTIAQLSLPTSDSPQNLPNNASYWIESLTYENSNQDIKIDVVGKYNGAFRKIRTKLRTSIPSVYNDYGLLTDGTLTIHGDKTLKMSVHANNGLDFTGGTLMENAAVATQSIDPSASTPHSDTNAVGGYVPPLDVPPVPISEYRTYSKQDGILVDMQTQDYNTIIKNAPAGSKIYLSNPPKKSVVYLEGDMNNKFLFIDGSTELYAKGINDVSNVTVITAGTLTVDGSADVGTSHSNEIDVVFAAGDDITLNGSRSFESLFWSNKIFRQNGSSMAGRVVSQSAILFNGSFVLLNSNKLSEDKNIEKTVNMSSWHLVPMNN